MHQTAMKEERQVLKPRLRPGTKTFLDLPKEVREKDFESDAGKYIMSILSEPVRSSFKKAILETGIESEEAKQWLDYALSEDKDGLPISPIARWVEENPFNPRAFKQLYGVEDSGSSLDTAYIKTAGAHGIFLRLMSLVSHLPALIMAERKKQGLDPAEKFIIYNIGSAYSLDTIYMMAENPNLNDLVHVVCVDPDGESLACGQRFAEKMGVAGSFTFVPEKVEEANLGQAHLVLFIGMFCPVKTKRCIFTLKFIKKHVRENGIVVFSTVQEKMLENGAILDFIMWSYGWGMYFKTDEEPGIIATMAGYTHERKEDWEDELGFNRMTVARKPASSILHSISGSLNTIRALIM